MYINTAGIRYIFTGRSTHLSPFYSVSHSPSRFPSTSSAYFFPTPSVSLSFSPATVFANFHGEGAGRLSLN